MVCRIPASIDASSDNVYKAVFEDLKRNQIRFRCLQLLPNSTYLIGLTCQDDAARLSDVGVSVHGQNFKVDQANPKRLSVRVKFAPWYWSHDYVRWLLSRYGTVLTIRKGVIPRTDIENGDLYVTIEPKSDVEIPSYLNIQDARVQLIYQGMKKRCFRCKSLDHLLSDCPNKAPREERIFGAPAPGPDNATIEPISSAGVATTTTVMPTTSFAAVTAGVAVSTTVTEPITTPSSPGRRPNIPPKQLKIGESPDVKMTSLSKAAPSGSDRHAGFNLKSLDDVPNPASIFKSSTFDKMRVVSKLQNSPPSPKFVELEQQAREKEAAEKSPICTVVSTSSSAGLKPSEAGQQSIFEESEPEKDRRSLTASAARSSSMETDSASDDEGSLNSGFTRKVDVQIPGLQPAKKKKKRGSKKTGSHSSQESKRRKAK